MNLDATSDEFGDFKADNLLIGASFTFDAWSVGAVYGKILSAEGELEDRSTATTASCSPRQYDLGGGASLNGGVRRTYSLGDNGRLRCRRRLDRRLRYLDVLLIPNNGTVRGEGGLRPAFSSCAGPRPARLLPSRHPRRSRPHGPRRHPRPHRRRPRPRRPRPPARRRSSPSPRSSPPAVRAVLDAGQRVFGENRVQEAEGRWHPLRAAYDGVALHLVGPLQTNKLARALDLFDAIHSLDRDGLAAKLATAVQARGACPTLFVQVNTGREPQKAGIDPDALDAFVARCRDTYDLPVFGLMVIPPVDDDPRPHFDRSPPWPTATASPASRWACPTTSRPRSTPAPPTSASARRSSAPARAAWMRTPNSQSLVPEYPLGCSRAEARKRFRATPGTRCRGRSQKLHFPSRPAR